MKRFLGIVMMSLLIVLFSGCGGGGSSATSGATTGGAGGAGAKGPFVQGSTVTAYKLESNGTRSTTDINTTHTTDNLGTYSLPSIPWDGPTEIVISGNYFNENTGDINQSATLSAIVDVPLGQTITANINIFTDLAAQNIRYQMEHNSTIGITQARENARNALVNLFDLNISQGVELEDLNPIDGTDNAAANAELLRVSAAVSRSPGLLVGLESGIQDGNITNDSNGSGTFSNFKLLVRDVNLTEVSNRLKGNDLNVTNPPDANDTDENATYVDYEDNTTALLIDANVSDDINISEDTNISIDLNTTHGNNVSLVSFNATSSDSNIVNSVAILGHVLTIVPVANANGTVNITVSANDGNLTDYKVFIVHITPVNDAPVANNDANTTLEDTNITMNVLSNDTDVDGDTLSIARVTQGTHGTVSHTASSVTYSPNANFNGQDSFTYSISDGNGGIAIGTVNITVTPVNDAPVLNPIPDINTTEDTPFSLDINATDADGDHIQYSFSLSNSLLAHGGISTYTDGATINITPNLNKNGTFTITARAEDGNGGVDTKTFTVAITPVNDVPVAEDDTNTTSEDTNITINVISNDTDVDGDTLSVISANQGDNGTVSHTASSVTYSPDSNFNGEDSFIYTVSDGNGGTSTATVHVIVTPVNDAPVANDDTNTTPEDTAKTLNILANDTDADGDTLSVLSVTQPAHGSVTIGNGSLSVIYTPSSNYNGSDSFTYTASDGHGGTATATVNLTVTAVNDVPVANDSTVNAIKNSQYSGTLSATDPDMPYGDTLTYSVVDQTNANGTVTLTDINVGTFTYSPTTDFVGDGNFTFKVTDSNGSVSNTATVTIHVVDKVVNITANDDNSSVNEDNNITIDVLANDVSVFADDNTTATGTIISAVSTPSNGTATIESGNIKYVPNANYNGIDSFTYTARSASGSEDNATVNIIVTPVNDAPVVNTPMQDQVAFVGDTLDTTIPSGTFTDVDSNDTMIYSANGLPDGISLSSDGNITGTFTTAGEYDINVTATDSGGLTASTQFHVTVKYAIQTSDVNNTAIILTDRSKITFYPDGTFENRGYDGNQTWFDQGLWEVNTTMHAVQLFYDYNATDIIALQDVPVAGGVVTYRSMDLGAQEDNSGIAIIKKVIDINGSTPVSITASDVNNTLIRVVNGTTLHLFGDGTFMEIDTNDNNISKYSAFGGWGVVGGTLGLVDENGVSETNITLTSNNPTTGTLGYADDGEVHRFVIRKATEILGAPSTPVDFNATDIARHVITFSDGEIAIFHGLDSDGQRRYSIKGRDDQGVFSSEGNYTVVNNVLYMDDNEDGTLDTNVTLHAALQPGALLIGHDYEDNGTFPLVVRNVFGYHGHSVATDGAATLVNSDISGKVIETANFDSYSFFPNGTFKVASMSEDRQEFIENYGTWTITGGDTLHVEFVYPNGMNYTRDIQFNETSIVQGTRLNGTGSYDGNTFSFGSVVTKVIDIDPNAKAIDMYPEYQYEAKSGAGVSNSQQVTIDGQTYTVVPFAASSFVSSTAADSTVYVSIYGVSTTPIKLSSAYVAKPIVLKVYKGSTTFDETTFEGSYGLFLLNASVGGSTDLGDIPFVH